MSSSRGARRGDRRGDRRGVESSSSSGGLIGRVRQQMLYNQRRRSRAGSRTAAAAARNKSRSTSRGDSSGKTTPTRSRSATRSRSRSGGGRQGSDNDEEHGNQRTRRSSPWQRFQAGRLSRTSTPQQRRSSPFDESAERARHVNNNNTTNNNNNRSNSRGRSSRRGRSRSWSNKSTTNKKKDDTPRCSTLLLSSPPGTVPSPRLDIWLFFMASSCACLVSLGSTLHVTSSRSYDFTGWDILALITCSLSLIIGLVMALGMRIGPSRLWFTKPLGGGQAGRSCVAYVTLELVLLSFLLFLWTLSISTLVDGTSTGGGGAVDESDTIWNANLFYSSWTTFLLCTYLWVEVLTLSNRGGVITFATTQEERLPSNAFTKRWTLLLFVSLVIFSASIATYTSPMCRGSLLKSTRYCSQSMSGILIGGLFQCFLVVCVAILYRLSHMRRRQNRSARNEEQRIVSMHIRDRGSCIIALVSLIVQCIHVALITSPTGGGPGNVSGTLYFGAWLGFASSFELCLRYLEFYTSASATNTATDDGNNHIPRRVGGRHGGGSDDVTVYEESKSEGDSPLGDAFEDQTYQVNDLMNSPSFIFPGGTIDTNPLKIEGRENKWPKPARVIAVGRVPVATTVSPVPQSVHVKDSTRKVKHNRKVSPSRPSTQHRMARPDPVPTINDRQMLQGKPPRPALPASKVDRASAIEMRSVISDINGTNYSSKEDTDDLSDCYFFDDMNLNSNRPTKDPSADINQQKSTSFHVEVLDDVQVQKPQRLPVSHMTFQRSGSSQFGLSPLVEKDSPETDTEEGISPPLAPSISSHATGGDLQKDQKALRSKASPSVSINISRKNSDMGRATPKQSNFSNKEQGADDSDSVILTVDDGESGSNPNTNSPSTKSHEKPIKRSVPPPPPFRRSPTDRNADSEPYYCTPVQSVYTSTCDTDSIISEPTLDAGLANDVPKPGPRSSDSTRRSTESTYKKKLSDDTNDKNSDDTQYEKKLSDDTEVYHSSDETGDSLRPHAGRNKKVVDSIVAAALAYAEKSLSASGSHDHNTPASSRGSASVRQTLSRAEKSRSFKSQGSKSRSFNSRSLRSRTPPPPVWKHSPSSLRASPLEQSQQQQQQQQRIQNNEHSTSFSEEDTSSSIHSLFSTSESLLDNVRSTSNSNLKLSAQPAPIIEGPSSSTIPVPIARRQPSFQRRNTTDSSLSLLTKESVGSMYSNFDDTETKNDDEEDVTGGEYDC